MKTLPHISCRQKPQVGDDGVVIGADLGTAPHRGRGQRALEQDVIDRLPQLGARAAYAKQAIRDALIDHKEYIYEHGEDAPEIRGWTWGNKQIADHLDSTEGDNIDAGVEAPIRN